MTVRSDRQPTRRSRAVLAALLALALMAAACGDDDDSTSTGDASAGSGGDDLALAIATPGDGDDVEVPFDVEFDSSVPLGPTDTGEHHVHLFFDGNEEEYDVVEGDAFTVERDLEPGEHTVAASLRNADHSDAGVLAEITVNVAGGSGGGGGDGSTDTTSDPYYG
jgi:hypothetical protein